MTISVRKATWDGARVLDARKVRQLVARTGLGSKFISKDDRITDILEQVSRSTDVILKGGTAINRIYLGPNARFSEDIDLDLLGMGDIDGKIASFQALLKGMDGFEISGPRRMWSTIRYDAYYIGELGEKDRVMIDLRLHPGMVHSIREPEVREVSPFLVESGSAKVMSYGLEDLLMQKLYALNDRYEGKDVYDLFFGLELDYDHGLLLDSIIYGNTVQGGKPKGDGLFTDLSERRGTFLARWSSLMNSTNHFIPRRLRPEWRGMINGTFDRIELLEKELKKS